MSLSKQQIIGAVGGGVFAVGALTLGWFLYSAWSGKGEAEEQLANETDSFSRYYNAAVFPSKASIESVKSNATNYAAWYDTAMTLAAQGDKLMPEETPPIFKQRLQGEVRRMLNLEGGMDGKIAASSFLFGFEQYLGEGGVLPSAADVPRLAVQLDTISRLVDAFAEAGVFEVRTIVRVENKGDEKAEGEGEQSSSSKKSSAKQAKEEKGPKIAKQTYMFELTARPEAIVATLNKLTSCQRFVVVRDLALKGSDVIVERLSAAEKAKADAAAGNGAPKAVSSRRRTRGAAALLAPADNPELQAAVARIVSDPESDDPMLMKFTVDVYDFGRGVAEKPAEAPAAADKPAEAAAAEKQGAEQQKPEEKKSEEKKPEEKQMTENKGDK